MILRFFISVFLLCAPLTVCAELFENFPFSKKDSVLVVQQDQRPVFSWQIGASLIPASLTKLATAYLAIDKWGLEHRFYTDFWLEEETLWVKGYGDPYLVSEELDHLVPELQAQLHRHSKSKIRYLKLDNSHFDINRVPGRSRAIDPYNAPVSAISVNFNTVKLSRRNGEIKSAEPQTPLTDTARRLAGLLAKPVERVNLLNDKNAQMHFAEILLSKLGWEGVNIHIDQQLSKSATWLYRHQNSHTVADVLRGTLEYSNNFMANQLFLKLPETTEGEAVSFELSRNYSNRVLAEDFSWKNHRIEEGSGLSRDTRLSAKQIDTLLQALEPYKTLFKRIKVKSKSAIVYAKTGTLDGVRSYAGFIEIPGSSSSEPSRHYRFVFNFNRNVVFGFRDQVLNELIHQLEQY